MKYTVDDILAMNPCPEYTCERLEKLMGEGLTPLEILNKRIPLDHKLWVGIRMLPVERQRAFARWCALQVVHLWNAPDVVVRYLKTGDESIRAASWDAAWVAARVTAWAAAWNAAEASAQEAAQAAAENTTWDATWAASWAAARNATWAIAENARDTAWDAETKKQVAKLRRMFKEEEG
jgi:hypothetical protein